jgi:hypothetical protein
MIQILTMSKLKEIWENQASSIKNEVIRERVENIPCLNCYVGTISFSKAKIFLLELDTSLFVHSNYLKRFVGVEIQVLPSKKGTKELAIILLENDLSDIFTFFIEDIINSLTSVRNQEDAIFIISGRINYWKKLFSKLTGGLLTPQQQRGLYGELIFLNDLLELNADKSNIINGWHGPLGANQDFCYNGLAVEVKTSKSNKPSMKISNEYQLDNTGLNDLYVHFYKLNEYQGGTETLFKLINTIRQNLNPESLIQFNEKLEYLGIIPETEEEYNNTSYSIGFEKTYLVTENFPKIIRNNLVEALSAVSYEIEPKLCTEFETDITLIFNHITNGNN